MMRFFERGQIGVTCVLFCLSFLLVQGEVRGQDHGHGDRVEQIARGIDIGNDRQWDQWFRAASNNEGAALNRLRNDFEWESKFKSILVRGPNDRFVRAKVFVEEGHDEAQLTKKIEVIERGIKILLDTPWFIGIPDLEVYCISNNDLDRQFGHAVFTRGFNGEPIAKMFVRDFNLPGTSRFGRWDAPVTNFIHDIGHLLHERHGGKIYWANNGNIGNTRRVRERIGALATLSQREFVAEVFTAQILNTVAMQSELVPDIYRDYDALRGPLLPRGRAQGIPR